MLGIIDLMRFLIGDADGIRSVLSSPDALPTAAVLVASAAIARNYDTRSFVHRPSALLSPFIVSFALAVVLYALMRVQLWLSSATGPPTGVGFLSLLAAYWMTAPLAWLYGLPFERCLPPRVAASARLLTLAIVALWRVLLMGRVLSIVFNGHIVGGYVVVLAFSVFIVIAAAIKAAIAAEPPRTTPQLVLAMAGIETKDRRIRAKGASVLMYTALCCGFGSPILLLAAFLSRVRCTEWNAMLAGGTPPTLALDGAMWVALAAIGFWAVLAAICQGRHSRAGEVDQMLRYGELEPALDQMARRARTDFPPAWEPEPGRHFLEPPTLLSMVERVIDRGGDGWAREHYLSVFREYVADAIWYYHYPQEFERLVKIVERLENRRDVARRILDAVDEHEAELIPHRVYQDLSKRLNSPDRGDGEPDDPEWLGNSLVHPEATTDADSARPEILARLREIAEGSK
ncbi:MAG: hypothetical protein ACKVS9_19020 [Phycisphaerae bacterium]